MKYLNVTAIMIVASLTFAHEQDDSATLRKLYKLKKQSEQSASNGSSREIYNMMEHVTDNITVTCHTELIILTNLLETLMK